MEPWLAKFDAGDPQAAWDLFAGRYRRLMLATIRRLVADHDDVMDFFSTVCQALSAGDFTRLKQYSERSARAASVATWLVTVVCNLTVDWAAPPRRAVAPHRAGRAHTRAARHLRRRLSRRRLPRRSTLRRSA